MDHDHCLRAGCANGLTWIYGSADVHFGEVVLITIDTKVLTLATDFHIVGPSTVRAGNEGSAYAMVERPDWGPSGVS